MALVTEKNRKWWILASMTCSICMTYIDVSVLPVALPTMQRQLNLTQEGLQWIINGYTLALTVFVLAGGKIADIFGHKKIFCLALGVFSLASLLCALSQSEAFLVSSRILQGIGGAILLPTSSSILLSAFPPEQRGKALGLYVSFGSIFLALGPFIGGSLTEYMSWHMIFLINIPIAIIGLILTLLFVRPTERKKEPFDIAGFSTLALGFTCIIIGVMQANLWGWDSWRILFLLSAGLVLLTFLFLKEKTAAAALIKLSLFKNKTFLSTNICMALNQFQLVITIFWAIYFQDGLGYSPALAGSIAFLANAPVLFSAPIAGLLVDRYGPKLPVTIGFTLIFFSLFWFICFPLPSFTLLLPVLIPFGFGVPLVFTPCFASAINQVADNERGYASGLITTLRQFSSTLGMAVFGSVFVRLQMQSFSSLLQSNAQTASIDPHALGGLLSKTPAPLAFLQKLPPLIAEKVEAYFTTSYLYSFSRLNVLALCMTTLGIILAFFLLQKKNKSLSE